MKESNEPRLTLKNVRRHFRTINSHRFLVFKYCCRCGIVWQGLIHDLSKYSPQEFWVGARYFQGDRSPNDAERRVTGASSAWMHHKGRNKHHYEYWTDYKMGEKEPVYTPVPMPNKYIIEMFCDRVAAGEIYHKGHFDKGYPLEYYDRCNTDRLMHPETAKKLRALLALYAEVGEEAFDIVKKNGKA